MNPLTVSFFSGIALNCLAVAAAPFERLVNFNVNTNGGTTETDFNLPTSLGFSVSQINGRLTVTKPAGVVFSGGGRAAFTSKFKLVPPFEIEVEMNWEIGNSMDVGLSICQSGLGCINIYFVSSGQVWGARYDGQSAGPFPSSLKNGKRIVRAIGDQGKVTLYRWATEQVWSPLIDANMQGPVTAELFVSIAGGVSQLCQATFDDLNISANGIAYSPEGSITINKAVQLCFPTERGRYYSLDWAPRIHTNTWTPLFQQILGSGDAMCFFDPVGEFNLRLYRLRAAD